jgi:hypothetical protein
MHPDNQSSETCESDDCAGPVREAGGTSGAGNPEPASRTGGATSGVSHTEPAQVTSAKTHLKNPIDPQQGSGAAKAPGNTPDPNFAAADHGPIKGAKHPEEPPQPSKGQDAGTAGPRRTSDQR